MKHKGFIETLNVIRLCCNVHTCTYMYVLQFSHIKKFHDVFYCRRSDVNDAGTHLSHKTFTKIDSITF